MIIAKKMYVWLSIFFSNMFKLALLCTLFPVSLLPHDWEAAVFTIDTLLASAWLAAAYLNRDERRWEDDQTSIST